MEANKSHEFDLPLSANYSEVCVEHYILDLSCNMSTQIFDGSVTLFIKVLPSNVEDTTIQTQVMEQIKLDCYSISVTECFGFKLSQDEQFMNALESVDKSESMNALQVSHLQLKRYWQLFTSLKDRTTKNRLQFELEKHCLKITVPDLSSLERIVVTVHFRTCPDGPSLMWTQDQDGRPCVFTIGDAFNNRSLFPSQDMPQAMATWHCNVTLSDAKQVVLMTGEKDPVIYFNEQQEAVFHYFNSYRMPASTFALAVGSWSCSILDQTQMHSSPHCRIHYTSSMKSKAVDPLTKYLPHCFNSIANILEPYPLERLDILIAPDCFDSLGLACPNLLILSQSLLSSDLSLFHRIAHELCHTWFGILLGPRNWTEEWLTEGMCCYLEDIVHAKAMQWTDFEERNELKSYIKYKLLRTEIDYTPSSLQMLRPDGDLEAAVTAEQSYVKNGISSERSHIHYVKGFFLLKLLEETAGQDSFLSALKTFIVEYKGKLFSSQELLEFFFGRCPDLKASNLSVSILCREWLDSPGLPQMLESFPYPIGNNRLYQAVLSEFELLKKHGASRKRKRMEPEKAADSQQTDYLDSKAELLADQTVLLLGLVVENPEVRIPLSAIDSMRQRYSIDQANAEVQHAWCEVVIQRGCKKWYGDVEQFLHQHRAMGLYLYGELMISERPELQTLAHRCYRHHRPSMPRAILRELHEILAIENEEGDNNKMLDHS